MSGCWVEHHPESALWKGCCKPHPETFAVCWRHCLCKLLVFLTWLEAKFFHAKISAESSKTFAVHLVRHSHGVTNLLKKKENWNQKAIFFLLLYLKPSNNTSVSPLLEVLLGVCWQMDWNKTPRYQKRTQPSLVPETQLQMPEQTSHCTHRVPGGKPGCGRESFPLHGFVGKFMSLSVERVSGFGLILRV